MLVANNGYPGNDAHIALDYQQALDYVYSFANFETRPADQQTRADYTLDRMRALMAELGDPQHRYPTVHIAGTKGKGSTAAMLASILTAAGYRTGLYTSPHLHTYRERIRIDDQLVSEEDVIDWIQQHRRLLEDFRGLTTFEVTTAMAFDVYARENVDVAVIEVGLGGRLDTTNVISPVLSVITPISLDHTSILGDTLAEIAHDKAGILKPGVPAVIGPQPSEALSAIRREAGRLRVMPTLVNGDWASRLLDIGHDGQSIEIRTPDQSVFKLWMPLIGAHEASNAATAVAAAYELRRESWAISSTAVELGLKTVEWPGRTEILNRRPWLMVDGAHNGASARCLLDTVDRVLGQRRTVLVFGASVDKRIGDMFQVLLPAAQRVIVTQADHPRAAEPDALRDRVGRHGYSARIVARVSDALASAIREASRDDLVLVTGSLFVVAEARLAWFEWTDQPLPPHDPPQV